MKALRPLIVVAFVAVAACSSTGPIETGTASSPTDIPSAIAAPSGATLALELKGVGIQNYECRAKAGAAGGYDWVFVVPRPC